MGSIETQLLFGAGFYLLSAVGVLVFWLTQIVITMLAKSAAPILELELSQRSSAPHLTTREGLAYFIKDLDELVRDNPASDSHEIDEYVLTLAVAHLLRTERQFGPDTFATVHGVSPDQLNRMSRRVRMRNIVPVLRQMLSNANLPRIEIFCLALRLIQNWRQVRHIYA
jgi:hypothetical protein